MSIYIVEETANYFRIAHTHLSYPEFIKKPIFVSSSKPNILLWYSTKYRKPDFKQLCSRLNTSPLPCSYHGYPSALIQSSFKELETFLDLSFGLEYKINLKRPAIRCNIFIYILELEQGKYYVGKTTEPNFRINTHFNSNGSVWTSRYRPVKLLELIPNCDDYDEDKYTKMYMDKFGIDNVRGGSFVSMRLEQVTIEQLKKMSNGTNDRCFSCNESGHFAKHCMNK